MITKTKLLIHSKYAGDIDAWARLGSKEEKSVMSDDDWYMIDKALLDIGVNDDKIRTDLLKYCDNTETVLALHDIYIYSKI